MLPKITPLTQQKKGNKDSTGRGIHCEDMDIDSTLAVVLMAKNNSVENRRMGKNTQ
jgi:hypothetical protein